MNVHEILGFNKEQLLKLELIKGECINISLDDTEIDKIDDKE